MGRRTWPPRPIESPSRWRTIEPAVWDALWPVLLGTDQPRAADVRRILITDTYQPDSFTVAERLCGPRWLDADERDGDAWLDALVRRRLPVAVRATGGRNAVAYVTGEVRRVLDYRVGEHIVAETLWNQEAPYLVDRVIGWCLYGDADRPNDDVAGGFNQHGSVFAARFLSRFAGPLDRLDTSGLARIAVAAGLIGLDRKGGAMRCPPIPLPRHDARVDLGAVWRRLRGYAEETPVVDHLDGLLDQVGRGDVRLVWWLDDLIETAFDLLLIQRLVVVNPRLRVIVVPKRGRHDNDACTADVNGLLRLTPLARLRNAVNAGSVTVSEQGPRMATANPTKLHPTLVEAIAACDVMVCKGGRVHEMFNGNVAAPMVTAYVVVRPFTETQSGVDSTRAPLMVFGAQPGEWSWWGFQSRADRTLSLPSGRTIPACQSTVAEHAARAHGLSPLALADDLANLLAAWPAVCTRYGRAARAEIRLMHDRLAPYRSALPSPRRRILNLAHEIITTGVPVRADRHT